jgi:hypothetical protein
MKQLKTPSDTDIAAQKYRGPSPVVAALGEGALQTKFLAIIGLLGGGLLAYFLPKQGKFFTEATERGVGRLQESPYKLVQGLGSLTKWFISLGDHMVGWFKQFDSVQAGLKRLDEERVSNAINAAVVTSAGASIIGSLAGGGRGVISARAGRQQFETAQTELIQAREKNAVISQKLVDTELAKDAAEAERDSAVARLRLQRQQAAEAGPSTEEGRPKHRGHAKPHREKHSAAESEPSEESRWAERIAQEENQNPEITSANR